MASFGGTSFSERGDGPLFPVHGAEAQSNRIHIPGGSRTVVQTGGTIKPELTLQGYTTSASDMAALRSKVGTTASLVYAGGTVTAFLKAFQPQEIRTTGKYFFQLIFWVQ